MKFSPIVLFLLALLCSCEGPEGAEGALGPQGLQGIQGLNSLVDVADEPAGTNCAIGGLKITSGIDRNSNNVLDGTEVTLTKYVCNGANGISTLLTSAAEPAGVNCPVGGTKVQAGKDSNRNGQLDTAEIEQTRYVCNGTPGPKEIRLFQQNNAGTNLGSPGESTDPTVPLIITTFEDFTKENYAGYDSAVFTIEQVTIRKNTGPNDDITGKKIIVELVDRSNGDAPIPGTQMSLANGGPYRSPNFFKTIPAGTRDLGISVKSSDQFFVGTAFAFRMVIARK